MNTWDKINSFSINMPFETAEDAAMSLPPGDCPNPPNDPRIRFPVTQAHLPNGKTIPLLKTMQTSVCENNCNYCCFRAGRDTPRASLTPDELASAVVKLSQAKIAQGVFLSSGIAGGGVCTQSRIIDTAEILRHKYHYQHYIHLKIMPGAEKDQILRAMQLADRVSINLEGPNETALAQLAPRKTFFDQLITPLKVMEDIRQNHPAHLAWKHTWPSSTTQFVVGAVGETDLDLLQTTQQLRDRYKIARVYYSNFSPVRDTPFDNRLPPSPWRQQRLYQAFFLLRDYQFNFEDLPFTATGNLSLRKDPKLLWAEQHLLETPIEVNTAAYPQLLKIPGIGPISARKILQLRIYGKIREISALRALGVPSERAARFILLAGRRPAFQPGLFG